MLYLKRQETARTRADDRLVQTIVIENIQGLEHGGRRQDPLRNGGRQHRLPDRNGRRDADVVRFSTRGMINPGRHRHEDYETGDGEDYNGSSAGARIKANPVSAGSTTSLPTVRTGS